MPYFRDVALLKALIKILKEIIGTQNPSTLWGDFFVPMTSVPEVTSEHSSEAPR